MTDYPLITIGITAFNAQNSIENAVTSAFMQDWSNVEIVVVDDASSDNTFDILESLKNKHPKLRIFQNKKNSGVAVSRNKIIDEAKGEFIAFFDDDDESLPYRLTTQYNRITQYEHEFAHNAHVICHSARTQIYPDGKKCYEHTMGTKRSQIAPNGYPVAQRVLTGKPFQGAFGSTATCSQMARASIYRKLGSFDPDFRRSEDTDFNIRLALAGGHFIGIKEPLVTQTMTLTSDKKLNEELSCTLRLFEKHKAFINQKSSYSFCRDWINAKYYFLSGYKLIFLRKLIILFIKHPVETTKRIYWALPNLNFNIKLSRFHNEQ